MVRIVNMLSDGLGARVEANKLFACPPMQYGLWNVEAGEIDDARPGTALLTASGAGSARVKCDDVGRRHSADAGSTVLDAFVRVGARSGQTSMRIGADGGCAPFAKVMARHK